MEDSVCEPGTKEDLEHKFRALTRASQNLEIAVAAARDEGPGGDEKERQTRAFDLELRGRVLDLARDDFNRARAIAIENATLAAQDRAMAAQEASNSLSRAIVGLTVVMAVTGAIQSCAEVGQWLEQRRSRELTSLHASVTGGQAPQQQEAAVAGRDPSSQEGEGQPEMAARPGTGSSGPPASAHQPSDGTSAAAPSGESTR